jgi:hypothetical protein
MLSKFIKKIEKIIDENPSTKGLLLVSQLRIMLDKKGDIVIDLDHMCKHLGIKIK